LVGLVAHSAHGRRCLFIHRPNLYKKKDEVTEEERAQTDLIIAKQRNGPVDRIQFVFLGKYTLFQEAATGSWATDEE
jgi:replicative DNA helicase